MGVARWTWSPTPQEAPVQGWFEEPCTVRKGGCSKVDLVTHKMLPVQGWSSKSIRRVPRDNRPSWDLLKGGRTLAAPHSGLQTQPHRIGPRPAGVLCTSIGAQLLVKHGHQYIQAGFNYGALISHLYTKHCEPSPGLLCITHSIHYIVRLTMTSLHSIGARWAGVPAWIGPHPATTARSTCANTQKSKRNKC